jgi:thymidylate synthase
MPAYRNAEHAFVAETGRLLSDGSDITVRGQRTREMTGRSFTLQNPRERCVTVRHRNNSIAATIAETMWVLAGRNDIGYLLPYLPRAEQFSDDGKTWRAGYGPRLRDWRGVDQLDMVRQLLLSDPSTRRATVSLFDPATDFTDTLDVPCNNWLHFLRRGDRLDLSIAVRSNDIVWGFSGINAFEWSVIHELVATWTGVGVGHQHWLVGSMHIYERHFERGEAILRAWNGRGGYELGHQPVQYRGSWPDLPRHLEEWFRIEEMVRSDPEGCAHAVSAFPEPLFRSFLQVLRAHWLIQGGSASSELATVHEALVGSDVGYAVQELASRQAAPESLDEPGVSVNLTELRLRIAELHQGKSRAYGASWKRRGELVGVLANIARKVDRIENSTSRSGSDDETLLETVVDLYVYLLKYQTFLADQDHKLALEVFADQIEGPKSEGVAAFEYLLARSQPLIPYPNESLNLVVDGFAELHRAVETGHVGVSERFVMAQHMSRLSLAVILDLLEHDPYRIDWLTPLN